MTYTGMSLICIRTGQMIPDPVKMIIQIFFPVAIIPRVRYNFQ